MGLGALAIVGLVRALQRKSPLEEVAPGPEWGTVREAETTQCTAPIPPGAMRGGPDPANPLVWGKPPRPLVAQGRRCYVARLARPSACCPALPECHSTAPTEPVQHIWGDLHTCGLPCGQHRRWTARPPAVVTKERWVLTAAEIWDQGSTTLREQLAPATWAAWFPGVRPLDFDGETLLLSVPSSLAAERIRSSYSGMLTDAIHDSTGVTVRVELLVETETQGTRELVLFAPARLPRSSKTRPRPRRRHARRAAPCRAATRRRPRRRQRHRHLGLGHTQRPLHVRPVRHRRVEPLRPRRRAVGRREPGPVLQPALHLRARRAGQDPPPPRHRPPRPHRVPQQAGALRVDRVVHERVRRRHPGQGHARASSAATATSTSCSSTTSSSSNAPRSSRRSSSTPSTSCTARVGRSSSRPTGRPSRSAASRTASAPASSGASSPTSSRPSSRPGSRSSARRPNPSTWAASRPRSWRSSPPTSATTSASSRAR